ncbi:DNA gyrase inhibitor YacG [Acidovorax radicis]|uniref:DNA gyrase inhibitor YacG n=1 Tax=Acidovorax radicis TaxID=758826 RepID=UPI001CF8962B|nr:DNA gyrase inhibitor YacG [Acidovorax radicis]UCU98446.1 DNA gyrase inhibitor YacG [Acidovorax radicis]
MANTTPPESTTARARIVACPTCGGDSIYSPANAFRPFCSERCKQVDLGAWASEDFRMPTEAPPMDAPYGDPRTQSH